MDSTVFYALKDIKNWTCGFCLLFLKVSVLWLLKSIILYFCCYQAIAPESYPCPITPKFQVEAAKEKKKKRKNWLEPAVSKMVHNLTSRRA